MQNYRSTIFVAVLTVIATLARYSNADSIVVDGQKLDNVYITSSSSLYLVSIPETGKVTNVKKSDVKPEDVVIDKDASKRAALYNQWKIARDAIKAEQIIKSAPPAPHPPTLYNVERNTQPPADPVALPTAPPIDDAEPEQAPYEYNEAAARRQAIQEQIAANQQAARARGAARNETRSQIVGITSETVRQQQAFQDSQSTQYNYSRTLPDLDMSKPVSVRGYTRKDGTYVRPHTRNYPSR